MRNPFKDYNANMGGVDLFDQSLSTYHMRISSKMWWWLFLAWSTNATVVNAWRLFCKIHGNNIPLLSFIRELVLETLGKYGRNQPTQSFNTFGIAWIRIKLDTLNHVIVKVSRNIVDVNSVEEGPFSNAKNVTSVCI